MMNEGASSDEGSDAGGPALPAGVLKSSTTWGDDLEMKHKRERIRQGQDGAAAAAEHTAVDINQFRNVEVGSGYQARHVVRQRTANEGSGGDGMKVRDMTRGASGTEAERSRCSDRDSGGKEKRKEKDSNDADKSSKGSRKHKSDKGEQNAADRYLNCEGVREFRLELEKILSSA